MAVLNFAVSVKFVLKFFIKYLKGNDSVEYVSLLSSENSFLIQVVVPFIFGCCGMNTAYMRMEWCLYKGRSVKPENIGKRQTRGFPE